MAGNKRIQDEILHLQDLDKTQFGISASDDERRGMVCWDVSLNTTGRDLVSKIKGVADVILDCGNDCPPGLRMKPARPVNGATLRSRSNATEHAIRKRDAGFTAQKNAKDELVFVSAWPKVDPDDHTRSGLPVSLYGGKFVFDKDAGKGAVVYLLDTVSGAFVKRASSNLADGSYRALISQSMM